MEYEKILKGIGIFLVVVVIILALRTHYSILTPIPYFWLYNENYGKKSVPEKFNWMKMFYLNPADHLPQQ